MKVRCGCSGQVIEKNTAQLDEDWEVIGVERGEGAPLRVYGNARGGYFKVRRGGLPLEGRWVEIMLFGRVGSVTDRAGVGRTGVRTRA